MLCALTVSAVSFASPYKGSGRRYIHTAISPQIHSNGFGGGLAQAPSASMTSTSYRGMMASTTTAAETTAVQTIHTSASSLQGGVTSSETYNRIRPGSVRRAGGETPLPGGACSHCVWLYDKEKGTWYCPYCDCEPEDGECEHHCVPLDFNWTIALFMTALATTYAIYKKKRTSNATVTSVMVTRC